MNLIAGICTWIGLAVVCLAVAAVVLSAGGNLACGLERADPNLVIVVCGLPTFGGQP